MGNSCCKRDDNTSHKSLSDLQRQDSSPDDGGTNQPQRSPRSERLHSHDQQNERSRINDVPHSTPVPQSPATSNQIVIALYDFNKQHDGMEFRCGDKIMVLHSENEEWFYGTVLPTGPTGSIPKNYVASATSLQVKPWFFGDILRKEAEQRLMDQENPRGTFLIRKSETKPNHYSLSLKDIKSSSRELPIKHYSIKVTVAGRFYIQISITFRTLSDLVDHYIRDKCGLAYNLVKPCPRSGPVNYDLSRETKDNWEIPRSSVKMVKKIGEGNFGEVWYGKYNETVEIAVKTLKEGTMSRESFLEEAKIMKEMRHRNILILFAVCTLEEPIYIITEYMEAGALISVLKEQHNLNTKTINLREMVFIIHQVAAGMAYLEQSKFIHRDLAARNVLVGNALTCKIADFGLARHIEDEEYNTSAGNKFPVKWTAPESMIYNTFTTKSDVWSYGILLYEVITLGAVPYPGMNNRDVVDQVPNGLRMNQPKDCPDAIYDLMVKCWQELPKNRITFTALEDYLQDYNVSSEIQYY